MKIPQIIIFYFGVILSILSYSVVGVPYEPGTPGKVWNEEEIKIVRGKIIRMLDGSEYRKGGAFMKKMEEGPRKGEKLFTGEDTTWINRPMPSRVIRLAFHDCISSWDGGIVGEGNRSKCDGCLHWDDDEMNFLYTEGSDTEDRTVNSGSFSYDIPPAATNNGLKTILKALEYVYEDPYWPPGAEKLETSLKGSGKSRADLWQFAANVAVELEIERSNFACTYDKTNQQSAILEGGEDACLIKLDRPMPFSFGRKDCISDGGVQKDTSIGYKTSNLETPFDPHGSSNAILEGMSKDFNLTTKESIALMATHSTAPNKPNERENFKYGWIGNYLSNMYFKYLAMVPTYNVEIGMNSLVPDNFILRGDEKGNPIDGRRWRLHSFNQWKKESDEDEFSGPFIFRPTFEGCRRRVSGCDGETKCNETTCEQMFQTPKAGKKARINKLCQIGFQGNDPKIATYNEFCDDASEIKENYVLIDGPEYEPTKKSQKVCKKPLSTTSGLGAACDKQPLFALTYEMNFVYDFEIDSQRRPRMGEDVNEEVAKHKYALLRSDFPKNEDTFVIIEEFANNQQIWSHSFFDGWEKIQNNVDYELTEDPTKMAWLGYSFFEKEDYDKLKYPLLFTDNDKSNPKFFARTNLPGDHRLMFTDFREICNLAQTEDEFWIQNDLGPEYNPCPSTLMEPYSCPIEGCDPEKCAIHWSLCN